MNTFTGFIVHGYADIRRNKLYLLGRLDDGRSFAVAESRWRPPVHISECDREQAERLLSGIRYRVGPSSLQSFSGTDTLLRLDFPDFASRSAAARLLEEAGIPSPDCGTKPADLFLIERYIRGPAEINGEGRQGRKVDLIFSNPELRALDDIDTAGKTPVKIASVDIETDTKSGAILAAAISVAVGPALLKPDALTFEGLVRVLLPDSKPHFPPPVYHTDEADLLRYFIEDINRIDPDVLTGWNFLDFDFPRLADRCRHYRIPFALGRAGEAAKFFPGEGRRSAAAHVPGRQVIDSLRIVRSEPRGGQTDYRGGYSLEAVAQAVLGEGKSVSSSGEDKLAELEKLYREDPAAFGEYCYRDACLPLRILAKTGLWRLTLERAILTGVTLDKAWTSVVSFERIYAMELHRRFIAPPPAKSIRVTGAAGGTVLDSSPGLFSNIAVFDFRSLYPTIMRTFNVDPLSHARAKVQAGDVSDGGNIIAPNDAAFSRKTGLLPGLLTEYFSARRRALDTGDGTAAQVYKILMNSFYGVLGTPACRYGRTELAGAITSFARKWLLFSRDWFNGKGLRVLYGDTDSLFVETGLGDDASYEDFDSFCGRLAREFNAHLSEKIKNEYGLESHIELRFEKVYRRFLIPPIRAFREEGSIKRSPLKRAPSKGVPLRGRAKGYGGAVLGSGGTITVEVKGMEAVRSDSTPLARRLQMELLELVFSGCDEKQFVEKVRDTIKQLRQGKLDAELVYRKRLSRPPETYTASTPPQVKAARALGWQHRRGTVAFVWTKAGPAPVSLPHEALDYDHYTDSQVLPLARSIASAALWNTELFPEKGRSRRDYEDGQMELGF